MSETNETLQMVEYGATGRRKCAVARVRLIPGEGRIRVNKRPFEEYFQRETDRIQILEPLKLANVTGQFNVEARVSGGGITGQAGALKLALARALLQLDGELRPVLRKAKALTRDPRMKERKKPGQKGARRKFQWVKR